MDELDALVLARAAYDQADMYTAQRHIERVLAEPSSGNRLAWTRITAGEIYRAIGDTVRAIEHLTALIDHWDDYPDVRVILEAHAHHNLGLAYRQRRQYPEALACAETAGRLWRARGYAPGVVWSHLNRAWILCLVDRPDEAHGILSLIGPMADELNDAECLWGHRLGMAHVAITSGDYTSALQLAGALISQPDMVPVGMLAQASVICGRALLGMGDVRGARETAASALEIALRSGDSRVMNDVQALRRRISYADSEGA